MKIDRDRIMEALGLEQSNSRWIGIALAGFGVGTVVGAAVAMLMAPKSGLELRADIMEKGRDLLRRGREVSDEVSKSVSPSH